MCTERVTLGVHAIAECRHRCCGQDFTWQLWPLLPCQGRPGYTIHVRNLKPARRQGLDGGRARLRVSAL
jgi:hypothetical protein